MMIRFSKMHGLGNDFVVIDAIHQPITLSASAIRFIADRHFGIGCDQVLLVEKPVSKQADFKYRIFNADGSEVAQCGNGARCFARFVREKGLSDKDVVRVDTDAGQLVLTLTADGQVSVDMGVPEHDPAHIPLAVAQQSLRYSLDIAGTPVSFYAVSMGNPHAVILVEDVDSAPVASLGPKIENHPAFPQRVNVGFMQVIDNTHIRLRVYERGAAETLACGSGACAAVVAGIAWGLLDNSVSVRLPGGLLEISWQGPGQPVLMKGPAVCVYEGEIDL